MKYILSLLLLLISSSIIFAQGISVASFRALPTDMTARVTDPVKDRNGDKAALIRVVTTQTGFKWEAGLLGITEAIHKTGEYWLYVPYGSRKLSIMHPDLGVLRNYIYPEPIEEATVYEMVLTTGTVRTVVRKAEIKTQYLIFKSNPPGADIYINDTVYLGQTPLDKEFPLGEYTYRISKTLYFPSAGKVILDEADGREDIDVILKPDFGSIEVLSMPESGAEVFLDNKATGKYTPCTLEEIPSGEHSLSLRKEWYAPSNTKVRVIANEKSRADIKLKAAFAHVRINTNNEASIFINDEYKSKAQWEGRLKPGLYTIEAKKDKYFNDKRQLQLISGEDQNIELEVLPITGDLKIASDPFDAEVFLNGENKGRTPLTLRNLLIGSYSLELKKDLHAHFKTSVQIKKNETTEIDQKLASGMQVSISSEPSKAKFSIDGKSEGYTDKQLSLPFGEHQISISKEKYTTLNTRFTVREQKKDYSFKLIPDEVAEAQHDFKRHRRAKYFWLGITAISAGTGIYAYTTSNSKYDEYQQATEGLNDLENEVKLYDNIKIAAFTAAGAGLVMVIIKAVQQGKAKSRMQMALVPTGDGAMMCFRFQLP